MTTSGTYNFDPTLANIVDEAWERCGMDPAKLTARHLQSARRSLIYTLQELVNLGVRLWLLELKEHEPDVNEVSFSLPAGSVDLLDMVVTTPEGVDIPMFSHGRHDYHIIPNKTFAGLPVRFFVDRQVGTLTCYVWPVPDRTGYVFKYWRLRQGQDMARASATADVPWRFQEALVARLAAKLAEKYAPEREQGLVMKAVKAARDATLEDRERAPTLIQPEM